MLEIYFSVINGLSFIAYLVDIGLRGSHCFHRLFAAPLVPVPEDILASSSSCLNFAFPYELLGISWFLALLQDVLRNHEFLQLSRAFHLCEVIRIYRRRPQERRTPITVCSNAILCHELQADWLLIMCSAGGSRRWMWSENLIRCVRSDATWLVCSPY